MNYQRQMMSNHSSTILPLDIVITPNELTIQANESVQPSGQYLHIRTLPTRSGDNLASISIRYGNVTHNLDDSNIMSSITHSLVNANNSLADSANNYIAELSDEDRNTILLEYSKYMTEGIILDGLIAGIAAYYALLTLFENHPELFPIQFNLPENTESGLILSCNMLQYIRLALLALVKIVCDPILLKLIVLVLSFINIWEPVFFQADIDPDYGMELTVEIITGLTEYTCTKLERAQTRHLEITKSEQHNYRTELNRLQNQINDLNSKIQKLMHANNSKPTQTNTHITQSVNNKPDLVSYTRQNNQITQTVNKPAVNNKPDLLNYGKHVVSTNIQQQNLLINQGTQTVNNNPDLLNQGKKVEVQTSPFVPVSQITQEQYLPSVKSSNILSQYNKINEPVVESVITPIQVTNSVETQIDTQVALPVINNSIVSVVNNDSIPVNSSSIPVNSSSVPVNNNSVYSGSVIPAVSNPISPPVVNPNVTSNNLEQEQKNKRTELYQKAMEKTNEYKPFSFFSSLIQHDNLIKPNTTNQNSQAQNSQATQNMNIIEYMNHLNSKPAVNNTMVNKPVIGCGCG
jgi:hypothetical protein